MMRGMSEAVYIKKTDMQQRVYGIEQYVPGDESARGLEIMTSGGTTNGVPVMLVDTFAASPGAHGAMYGREGKKGAIIKLSRAHPNLSHIRSLMYDTEYPNAAERVICLSHADITKPDFSACIRSYAPTDIYGSVSFTMFFINQLIQAGAPDILREIKSVTTVGELLDTDKRKKIAQVAPDAEIRALYAVGEIGGGVCLYTCPETRYEDTATYHLFEASHVTVDIIEPDENGVGEIVIGGQFGNFCTGDIGSIDPTRCSCGASEKVSILGRKDYDIVSALGAVFYVSEVKRVFAELSPQYVSDYLVEVSEKEGSRDTHGQVRLTVVPTDELRALATPHAYITSFFDESLFVTKTRTLAQLIAEGIFLQTEVQFADHIDQGRKEVHLKKVIS